MTQRYIRTVSGNGYGYALISTLAPGQFSTADERAYGITLALPGVKSTSMNMTYQEAERTGELFSSAMHQWNVVQRRAAVLAQGYAIIG